MFRLQRIFKNYAETGSFNELVNLYGFVDSDVFLTKTGDLGVVLEVRGVDYECLDGNTLDGLTKRLESALKLLDENYRIYQYLFKRNNERIPYKRLVALPTRYLVLVLQGTASCSACRERKANSLFLTIALLLAAGFWLLGELKFFIPYKSVLFHEYGTLILVYLATLFLNLFAAAFALNRKFFLKDTGRKLSHLDKQLHVGQTEVRDPSLEEEVD